MPKPTRESRDLTSLIGKTSRYNVLQQEDPEAARKYWDGTTADFQSARGYSPAEFTALSWAADEIVKKFNEQVKGLEYAEQEA